MFSNKTEVDRHVENALKKINSETERNLRCFTFAKLYFAVGDFEQARRYVSSYLSVKPNSAEAHRLLGKCLENLNRKQAALEAYRTSLQLDPKQNSLVIKVCELLAEDNVNLDQSGARYYCELAQSIDPKNPIVYSLKERLITSENDDPKIVSNLLLKELENRPTDVNLRVCLLKHFLQCNMIKEAYKHAIDVETKDLSIFLNNLSWYEIVSEILTKYQQNTSLIDNLDWEYWFLSVSVSDKLVSLTLDERSENIKNSSAYIGNVFNFDQILYKAGENLQNFTDRQLVQEFLNHYKAQLCFHLATLMLKQAKKDFIQFREATNLVLPLLFIAYHTQPPDLSGMWINHITEVRRKLVQKWHREGSFRCSQSGHVLLGMAKDRKSTVIEKAHQYSTGMWKENLFKKLFITRDQQLKMSTSSFLNNQDLGEVTIRLPEENDLLKYDEVAQLVYPDSLHHYIWIYLNNNLSNIKLTTFDGLQYTVKNLKNCGAETLNILDLQAFIYCATICAKANLDEFKMQSCYSSNTDKPNILPVSITQHLGTVNQYKFFMSAYKMYKNEYDHDMGELRLVLIKGIEVVRCLDHHGLDVKLLITLAKTFSERAKILTKQSEIEANEIRAELYWKAALPLLEKLKNNQVISYPTNRVFNYKSKEMSLLEICSHIENGKLFTAQQLLKKKEFERALRIFEMLKDPYASFYQAQIYKQMADQQLNQNKENVTSEMRSQHIILLSKARDCLYLTLDRLREPSVDTKHPLNCQLGSEIEKIERLLSRIDSDCTNRNECDGMSDDNVSSVSSDHYITGYAANSFLNGPTFVGTPRHHHINNHSTPRFELSRREARPSPERLDAQLRQLAASKDAAISHILEQNKIMLDSHRHLVDELRCFKDAVNNLTTTVDDLKGVKHSFDELKSIKKSVDELKTSVDELENFKTVTDLVYEMKKEITELKKDIKTNQLTDEDIYGLTTDYGTDYSINTTLNAFNSNSYANYQGRMLGAGSNPMYPPIYPGMYPPMAAYYGGLVPPPPPPTSGLPFGTEQDIRAISAVLSTTNYGQGNLGLPSQTVPPPIATTNANMFAGQSLSQTVQFAKPNQFSTVPITGMSTQTSKAPPVNVVITSSDPLPLLKNAQSQPVLSVTIPPQHLKGAATKPQPHNYQIPLPATNLTNTSQPMILNKPILPVSTQSLLSNVAAPVYSALADSKTPQKNLSLGLHIEKTLDETFSPRPASNDNSNLSVRSIDEDDPCPDFKPIIPLPDEVPVTTGEEDEIVLFSERAKLFRFQDAWKERGVGVLKLLKNPQTGKVRLLMRRDQVHKICANHFLAKEMSLTAKANSDRAYVWAAQDFANEEVVLEKFCVRFKTADEAKRFYDVFENAKKNLSASVDKPKESTPITTVQSSVSLGGFVFSSTPNFKNIPNTTSSVTITPVKSSSPFAAFTFNKPVEAKVKDDTKESKVHQISTAEDDDEFVPTAEFKPVVPLPDIVEIKTGEENCEVLFESRAKLLRFDSSGEKKDWKERGIGVIKILKDNTIRLVMRRDQVHKVCCNHQLLKNMNFKFMTNNNKALTWCAKDFSEGVLTSETFAIRFKTEELANSFYNTIQSAQACLDDNNYIFDKHVDKHMKPDSKSISGFGDKFKPIKGSWECKNCYIVNDGKLNYCVACETPKNDTVQVKGIDISEMSFSFGGTKPKSDWGMAFKPKEGSWECKVCYIRNDSDKLHCVSCDNPKNDTVPKKEAEKSVNLDTGGLKFSFGVPSADLKLAESSQQKGEVKPSWAEAFKPKPGSWECNVCYIRNDSDKPYCVSCDNPKNDTIPKKETEKGVNLDTGGLKFSFGIPSSDTKSVELNQQKNEVKPSWPEAFKPKPGSWECKVCYIRNGSDKLYCVSCESPKDDTIPKKEPLKDVSSGADGKTFTFGMPGASVFGQKSTQFSFGGVKTETDKQETPDKFVFGSPQKHDFEFTPKSPHRNSTGQKDSDSDSSNIEEECDNIYFKPVIPLPDKVDVKTGEEEEDVLYCHRAKLFRFSSGEWKERGIGDLKILKRKDNGKLRILMRREQVFKICLNHALTSDIEYKPKGDDKTWLFCAPDFSEGEISRDQFCLRFKNAEIAQEFKKAVTDALNGESSTVDADKNDSKINDDDVIVVSETKVTPEEEKEAIRLGLPPKYLSYRQLPDCTCEQCKKDDEYLKDLVQTDTSQLNLTNFNISSLGRIASPITPFNETSSSIFGTPSSFNFTSPLLTTTTKSESLKDLLSKPSLLAEAKSDSLKLQQSPLKFSTPTAGNLFTPKTETTSPFTFSLPPTTNIFHSTSTTSANSNVTPAKNIFDSLKNSNSFFGSTPSSPVTTSNVFNTKTTSIFGGGTISTTNSEVPPTTSSGLFSSGPTIFGGGSSSATTVPQSTTGTSAFGGSTTSIFGGETKTAVAPSTTATSIFAISNPVFGASATSVFGCTTSSVTPSTTGNVFSNNTTNSGIGSSKNTSIFGNSTNTTPSSTNVFGAATIFGGSTVFGQNKENNPVFGGTKPVENATTTNLKEDDEVVLNCNNGLSFASLAANITTEEPPAFVSKQSSDASTPFAFLGAGAPVFGSSKKDVKDSKDETKGDDEEEGGGTNADEEYDPQYEPIIPLPDAIVVSTGEEDETPVFNERAKLFRYDAQTKQWKERGVGQMKILHHPVNNTYRFLLRREQVHKVVLNQLIIPDLDLQPMTTSDKAWVWAGYNYTDDESALEKLAIRFKNCELAVKFNSVVQEVIGKVKEIQSAKMIPSTIQNIGEEEKEETTEVVHYEDNDEEDEDEEDDDDRSIMFTKRCTLSEQTAANQWQIVAMGELQVFYDPEFYAAKISFTNDNGLIVSNTLIGINTIMNIDKNSCMWDAVEWGDGDFRWRTLKATFSSEAAAQEFHSNYLEGLNYAQEFDIIDEIPIENEYVEEEEETDS